VADWLTFARHDEPIVLQQSRVRPRLMWMVMVKTTTEASPQVLPAAYAVFADDFPVNASASAGEVCLGMVDLR
jgi:hypothetical protein